MKKIRRRWYAAGIAAAAAGVALAILLPGAATSSSARPGNNILARALDIELGLVTPNPHEQLVSSGLLYPVLEASGVLEERANAVGGGKGGPNGASCASKFVGGGPGGALNIRVNQDCSLRRQSEEVIAVNPTNADNLIAGQNDSSIGFNHCGYDFSFDGGKTWGSYIPPFWQFVLLDGHTSDACSDPSVTFDADGNAYATGIIFDVSSAANAIVVAKSDKSLGGAFFHSPANLSFQQYRDVPLGVVANDNDPNVAHDKEFIVADAWQSSSKKNNVYLTWTRFTNTNAPIYFSQSTNGGATWSPGIEISGANPAICTIGSGSADPNACDQNQGSDPIVGSDGTIFVSFFNQNTPGSSNQHLVVKCPAANNCALATSWSAPVKITDDFGGQPTGPNAVTGCPGGRRCLPPNGYRVQDRTYGSISIDSSGKLYFVFSDFRNGGPPCTGPATTATPPCDQDVFYSYSTNGGGTWSSPFKLTPAGSAQWQPWSALTKDGSALYAGYYDRQYGNCESTGCNDITLAKITNPATASPSISSTRITTSSMPNMVVANNPIEAGFLGDYMWVATDPKGRALLVWGDNRGQGGAVEQDIYFAHTP
jgi:hypothetical protein